MKLTGLQIFKYLPGGKKEAEANCKKCGFPTCMAFSMKLAKGEVDINACEYVSDELRKLFEESSQLQQQEITFGASAKPVKIGGETVMFRHDKKFVNQTCFAIRFDSSDKDFSAKFDRISKYAVERVGETLTVDALVLSDTDETFVGKAKIVAESGMPLILVSGSFESMKQALSEVKQACPLVFAKNIDKTQVAELQSAFDIPVVISGSSSTELAQNSSAALECGIKDIVLNISPISASNLVQELTYLRRAAIEDKFKPLGFPVITFIGDIDENDLDPLEQAVLGTVLTCKYSNIVVLDELNEALMYALMTLRQNIYTDPEKPLQIEPKVYPLGEVDENSPVIVTTNFALTYFTVAGEIESSNVSSYLVVTPSDGMSVLTAWSADKFNGEIIAKAIKDYGIESLVKHRKLIIPGYVASLKPEIEEELPGWEVIVGANEAIEIADFLKNYQREHAGLMA
ncbi:MAG: acetyl-CoA decarbonylase/synthase complex subunit gamma [Candidatus Gastranaerophilales bacterium]|nr:acetyl-CoA decarbonylase/synthase complex subunit gamma [Candidatus Gastranaerophilales bacterium]